MVFLEHLSMSTASYDGPSLDSRLGDVHINPKMWGVVFEIGGDDPTIKEEFNSSPITIFHVVKNPSEHKSLMEYRVCVGVQPLGGDTVLGFQL